MSGYIITNREANRQPLPPKAELGWWYQYYFAIKRGRAGCAQNRHDFNKLIWQLASPKWDFDDATYERSAAAFDNSDHVEIVIHNYRRRLELLEGERLRRARAQARGATRHFGPTITIAGAFDGGLANGATYAKQFSGRDSRGRR